MIPYYDDGTVTIYHGDAAGLPIGAARLVTDPPYGAGAYETDKAPDPLLLSAWVCGFPTCAIFGYPETLVGWCVDARIRPAEWVTWWPTNKPGGRAQLLPRETEHVAIFGEVVGARRLFRPRSTDPMTRRIAETRGHDPETSRLGDVWRDASPGAGFNRHLRQHINEKPLSFMQRLIVLCSNHGDEVVDPYCGSGTTLVAAKALGRRAVGIEIEERYCEIAARRCAQEVLPVEAA